MQPWSDFTDQGTADMFISQTEQTQIDRQGYWKTKEEKKQNNETLHNIIMI